MKIFSSDMIKKYLFVCIATCTCVVYWIPYACNDFYNHFLEAYDITIGQAGQLITFFGLTATPGYFFGGWLADKFNPKALVVASSISTGIIGIIVALSSSFAWLEFFYLLFGVTTTFMHWSAFLKMIKNLGSDEEQGRLFGVYNFMFGAYGIFCTYLILFFMETSLEQYGFRGGMMIYCALALVFGILTWIFVPYDKTKNTQLGEEDKVNFKLIFKVLKMPVTWYIGFFTLGYFIIRSAIPYLNPYMTDGFGVSIALAALLTNTLRSGMNLVAGPIGGTIIDRLKSSTPVVIVGGIATLVFTIALIFVPVKSDMIILLMVVCVLLLFSSYINSTALYTPVTEAKIPFIYVGTVLGIASAIGYSSDIWLYNLCGHWIDSFGIQGYTYIWCLQGAGAVMMLVCGILLGRCYKKAKEGKANEHSD